MQPEFWRERWRNGQIGFHRPHVDARLQQHWPDMGLDPRSRVFVPLCGKSLDLLWLRDQGHLVAGVELSAVALEAFCLENGLPARRRTIPSFDVYQAPGLELYCGDYLALTPALLGEVAAVYDRAALISWPEDLQVPYVEHLAKLTGPGSMILLVVLEYGQAQMAGPPFSVSARRVAELYASRYEIRELSRQDILSTEPRLRGRGVTELYEVCYRLTRKVDAS
ncbi:MAG: thiopurine S-methyltransferase [Gammaproteobacteria bacterium]|nr:thiopurine S-methyltransferase [Gammaproteobacteria bacterium]